MRFHNPSRPQRQADALSVVRNPIPDHTLSQRLFAWAILMGQRGKRINQTRLRKMLGFATWAHDLLGGVEGIWRPGIHMPRWVSRITLLVTDVQIQRLQAISDEEAIAEGVEHDQERSRGNVIAWRDYLDRGGKIGTPIGSFQSLWDSLNAKRGCGWDQNPWVISITYKPYLFNIDDPNSGYVTDKPIRIGIDYARSSNERSILESDF